MSKGLCVDVDVGKGGPEAADEGDDFSPVSCASVGDGGECVSPPPLPLAERARGRCFSIEDTDFERRDRVDSISTEGTEELMSAMPSLREEEQPDIGRKSSQEYFSEPTQTVIILDFDDTLFPTTWFTKDLNLPMHIPLRKQKDQSNGEGIRAVTRVVVEAEREAVALLRLCTELSARVIVVTLASPGWVEMSCKNFMPRLGKALKERDITIMHARDYLTREAKRGVGDTADEKWKLKSDAKRAAIIEGVSKFYKQYEGQTWKNIVSIGDSDFEREATKAAIENYFKEISQSDQPFPSSMSDLGVDMQNKVDAPNLRGRLSSSDLTPTAMMCRTASQKLMKVRCKTVTLLDSPTVEELRAQCAILRRWLRPLVEREKGVDVRLTDNSHDGELHLHHKRLTGLEPERGMTWRILAGIDPPPAPAPADS